METIKAGVFRIGRDAELRRIPSGEAVINLSLAYNYGRQDSEGKQPTQWIEAGLWGKVAEALAEHLTKGKQVFCTIGDEHIETFNKSDGTSGHKLVGRIQSIKFVGPREGGGSRSEPQQQAPRGAPPARGAAPRPAPAAAGSGFEDMDDDIPF